jgi:hypothetical protein
MARNIIAVEAAISQANTMLATSTCSPDGRTGIIRLLEALLHAAGSYNGFYYLEAHEVPAGQLPGIIRNVRPNAVAPDTGHDFPDDTRRHYYHRTNRAATQPVQL